MAHNQFEFTWGCSTADADVKFVIHVSIDWEDVYDAIGKFCSLLCTP